MFAVDQLIQWKELMAYLFFSMYWYMWYMYVCIHLFVYYLHTPSDITPDNTESSLAVNMYMFL